jgi:hypothetical protein
MVGMPVRVDTCFLVFEGPSSSKDDSEDVFMGSLTYHEDCARQHDYCAAIFCLGKHALGRLYVVQDRLIKMPVVCCHKGFDNGDDCQCLCKRYFQARAQLGLSILTYSDPIARSSEKNR